MDTAEAYEWALFPPPDGVSYDAGDAVFVWLK